MMLRILTCVLTGWIIGVNIPAAELRAEDKEPVVAGVMCRMRSSVLKEERTYRVSLPQSYAWAKDRRYPVLLVLDGETHFLPTSASAGFLGAQGEIPEMITVGLDSGIRVRDYTQTDWPKAWIGGGGADAFLAFLAEELIPRIDRDYRTDGFRILSGHSAAGQLVLHALTTKPKLFHAYFALSPSLDWDDNLPKRELEAWMKSQTSCKAFLYLARSDDAGRALADYDQLVDAVKSKTPQNFRWHSQAFPEETHNSIPLLGHIHALRSLYAGYRFHDDLSEKGVAFAEAHYQKLSQTLGHTIAVPERVLDNLGYFALDQGNTREAIALFQRNVAANPNSPNAHDSLADGYAKAGDWPNAVRAAERAVALAAEFHHPRQNDFRKHAEKLRKLQKESSHTPGLPPTS